MKIPVLNLSGEKVKEIDLPKFFEMEFNPALVHQVMRWQLLNTYFPYAHTKTRSEVAGSGRKPWPQKHTGRARHGSRRSPIWRGGGITFGPRKEEKKQIKITKKMRRKAILMTVAEKFRKNLLKCFENFPLEGKTKEMAKFLTKFLEPRKTKKKYETCLLVIPENDKKIFQAVRNLPYADAIEARNLNLLSLLNHKYLFLTPESLSVIEKTFKK
jgi:large subunit ribosomal protein L4